MTKYIIAVISIYLMGFVMIKSGAYTVECRDILYITSILLGGWIAKGDD